jgi:hypothetical protein
VTSLQKRLRSRVEPGQAYGFERAAQGALVCVAVDVLVEVSIRDGTVCGRRDGKGWLMRGQQLLRTVMAVRSPVTISVAVLVVYVYTSITVSTINSDGEFAL